MTRGPGKFKTKRGGGRNFSRHLELDENGTAFAVDKWAARDKGRNEDDSDEEEEEEEEEEESEEESDKETAGPSTSGQPELTRAERKAAKKVTQGQKKKVTIQGEHDDDEGSDDADLINPNRVAARPKKLSELNSPEPLSRREREAKEKQEAKERYWKAHLAGKTDEAKADLARLARIRKEREEAQARRKAEADAKAAEIQAKAAAQGRKH